MESLKEIDRFFDEHTLDGKPIENGLLGQALGSRLFAIGSYAGEVIRRTIGGKWQADDNDPQVEINIALHLEKGSIIWPVQKVMKRLRNGSEDGIYIYGIIATKPSNDQ